MFNKFKKIFKKEIQESSTYEIIHSFEPGFAQLMNKLEKEYGKELFEIQGIASHQLDIVQYTDNFFSNSANLTDKTVDPNANNSDKSVLQYYHSNGKALMRLNSLHIIWKELIEEHGIKKANDIIEAVIDGRIFINDLHNVLTGYCYAFDLTNLVNEGMSFFKGNMQIHKPKRSDSFIDLVIQATSYISNQITGAIAYPNFFLYLDWYYRNEHGSGYIDRIKKGLTKNVKTNILHDFQNIIYSLNWTYRGSESSFTNLSVLDEGFISSLFGGTMFPDQTTLSKDNIRSVKELSKMFHEYFSDINAREGMFTFPVMTLACSITENKEFIDPEFVDWVSTVNKDKSLGNVFISEPTSFSSCCRLVNDYSLLYQNSFGVGGISIGSHRVSGLNLRRIEGMYDLKENLDYVFSILDAQRRIIYRQIKAGFLPLYSSNWMELNKQFSTIGFVGAFEFMVDTTRLIANDFDTRGIGIVDVFNYINQSIKKRRKSLVIEGKPYEKIYNLEQIPAESMAVRLAKVDRLLGYNDEYEMYSNQYIPLTLNVSALRRIKEQGMFDKYTSGGAILHLNYSDSDTLTKEQYRRLIELCKDNSVKYFSVNYVFNKCIDGHYSINKSDKCPVCGKQITDRYTRVVGFVTNVNDWNKTRREYEYPNRHFYKSYELN